MAEAMTDRYHTPSTEELEDQFNRPSYDKEKSGEKQELSNQQIQQVKQIIKDAQLKNKGIVCDKDELKYLNYLQSHPVERENLINGLPERLKEKAKHLEIYEATVRKNFPAEVGENVIKAYHDMTGEERQEAAKKLPDLIEMKSQENKDYKVLLKESKHLSENGELTEEAEKLFSTYDVAQGESKEGLKRQLLEKIREFKIIERECEQTYEAANDFYNQGKFLAGEIFLEHIINLCDDYPDSPQFQIIREWNVKDLANMKEHTQKDRKILQTQKLRDTYKGAENIDKALKYSAALIKQTDHFIKKTTNRHGVEVDRKPEDTSAYLKNLHQDADYEHRALLKMKQNSEREQIQGREQVEDAYVNALTNTKEGDTNTVLAASIQDKLSETNIHKRADDEDDVLALDTTDSKDFEGKTEEELEKANEEGQPEIVMDLAHDGGQNDARAERVKRLDLVSDHDMAVARGKRLLTTEVEFRNAFDDETQKFTNRFVTQQKSRGDIEAEYLDAFKEQMQRKTETGQMSQQFKKTAQDDSDPGIRFGEKFKGDQELYAQGQVKFLGDQPQQEKKGTMSNFAEKLRQARLEVRKTP